MQPSELAKVALAVWGRTCWLTRRRERPPYRSCWSRWCPSRCITLALIVAQPDLGQTISLGHHPDRAAVVRGAAAAAVVTLAVAVIGCAAVLAVSRGLPLRSDARVLSTRAADPQGPATRPSRRCTRWPTAGCSATGSARARPSGATCPTRTTTSSSRSSARNSGFLGAFALLALFALFAYTGLRIAALGRSVPAAAHRDRDDLDHRPGADQHRLRGRPAAGHRSAAAAGLRGRYVAGDHTAHVRHASPTRPGTNRRRSRRCTPGRTDKISRLAAAAHCREPYSPTRVEALRGRLRTKPKAPKSPKAGGTAEPATAPSGAHETCRTPTRAGRRDRRRVATVRHMEAISEPPGGGWPAGQVRWQDRRPRRREASSAVSEHWKDSVTGEDDGRSALGGGRRRRYGGPHRARAGGGRRADRA